VLCKGLLAIQRLLSRSSRRQLPDQRYLQPNVWSLFNFLSAIVPARLSELFLQQWGLGAHRRSAGLPRSVECSSVWRLCECCAVACPPLNGTTVLDLVDASGPGNCTRTGASIAVQGDKCSPSCTSPVQRLKGKSLICGADNKWEKQDASLSCQGSILIGAYLIRC
jgi:hypothetical protein